MAENSAIEWCHHTFNPWWGCTKVSPGCANCYADTNSTRWGFDVFGANADRRFFGDKHWNEPLKWNRAAELAGERRRVFCASMADVFEPRADLDEHRQRLWQLILETPWLDWLLLTKRPENVDGMVPPSWYGEGYPANVWLGTSVEDQKRADERIPLLLDTPAAVRFLSCEPLLGPVDLSPYLTIRCPCVDRGMTYSNVGPDHDGSPDYCARCDDTGLAPSGLHWVIVGGESGPGARPMNLAWARQLVEQCQAAGVAPFVKQLGTKPLDNASDGREIAYHGSTGKGGDPNQWPPELRVREFPEAPAHA